MSAKRNWDEMAESVIESKCYIMHHTGIMKNVTLNFFLYGEKLLKLTEGALKLLHDGSNNFLL